MSNGHDPATEKAAVQEALQEPELFRNHLDASDFGDAVYGAVWQAGKKTLHAGRPVNYETLYDALMQAGVEQAGSLLAELYQGYASPIYFDAHAQIIKQWRQYRDLLATWAQVQSTGQWSDGDAPDMAYMLKALRERLTRLEQAQREKRYTIFGAAEALQPRPPIEYVIEPIIAPGSVLLFFGAPGTGKTYAVTDMAVCVATGATWVGLPTKQTPVLLIDEESGPRRLQDRLSYALRGHYAGADTPVFCVSLAGFNFREQADLDDLRGLIQQTGAGLVFIDALADVMLGGNENSVEDTQPVFHGLRVVASATGAAIVVIHHSNRAGAFRGSSAIEGAVDVAIEFSRRQDSELLADIQATKNRDGKRVKLSAMMRWSDGMFDMYRALEATPAETFSKSERYVLRYLAEHAQATVKDVMDNADSCAPSTARTALYNLVDRGRVRRCDGGGSGQEAHFECLTDGASPVVP